MAGLSQIARGDEPHRAFPLLPSILSGVTDVAWTKFVEAMSKAPLRGVSESGALGCFEIRPKQLADLGLMKNLKRQKTDSGREIYVGDFVGMTRDEFLGNFLAQYNAFCALVIDYDRITAPTGVSRSEKIAVLHRAGPGALKKWTTEKFEKTAAAVATAAGLF